MSKEKQLEVAQIIKDKYNCRTVIDTEKEPYVLFRAIDVGKMLGRTNILQTLRKYKDKYYIKDDTAGGKQTIVFITYHDMIDVILHSRRYSSVEVCKQLYIDTHIKTICVEANTLQCIIQAFNGEIMLFQHSIGNYQLDLYFPHYKLAIECDELPHNQTIFVEQDHLREENIKQLILGCVFIRYKPYDKDFNIFTIINLVYKHIRGFV